MPRFKVRDFRNGINLFMKLLIFAMTIGTFIGMVVYFYHGDILVRRGYYIFAAIYSFVFLIVAISFEAFRIGIHRGRRLFFYYLIAIILTNIVNYFILSLVAKTRLALYPFAMVTTVQAVLGLIMYFLAVRIYLINYPARDCLVIHSEAHWEKAVARKFASFERRYSITEVCNQSHGYEALAEAILRHDTIILGLVNLELRQKLMAFCFVHQKRLFVLPSSEDIMVNSAVAVQINDSLVYLCKNKPLHLEQLIIKRLIDMVVSAVILLITLPLTVPAAIAIKLHDGGPIFFKQERYTRNGRIFTLIKFRSMVTDAEKNGAQFTVSGDERITPIGRLIRKTRIDEIPQIYNVFKGDMSLVGPRAERVETTDMYTEMLPDFAYRLQVKAGITGYAQIFGKYNTSFEDKARMDLYYVEECSIMMDLKLLLATIRVVFSSESTEGFDEAGLDHLVEKLAPQEKAAEDEALPHD